MQTARKLGISHRRAYGGWTPTVTYKPAPDGGYTAQESPEWDATEIGLMEALDELEAQTCSSCGGDLTVELTDKPPAEDDGDGHHHRVHTYWCRGCVAMVRYSRRIAKDNEGEEGKSLDLLPAASRSVLERVPND